MKKLKDTCRLALIQAAPAVFDSKACTEKAVKLIEECAGQQVELIVFPELFIPGYPHGMTFGYTVGHRSEAGRKDWKRYYDNSILAPGPETVLIGEAAAKAGAYVSIGVSESDPLSGTLYNSNLFFSPEGQLISVHRKMKPTGAERMVWGDAHQDYFPVPDTPWGPMGSLICWESYMPLARAALYQKGVTLYIAPNTNDNPEWQATVQHIALEGRCYVINSNMYLAKEHFPADLETQEEVDRLPEIIYQGGSCVVDPYGHHVIEPIWGREEIAYADLDMQAVPASRMELDVCGHYGRPDILELLVKE